MSRKSKHKDTGSWNRAVTFNMDDPLERGLCDFADTQSTNFSGYVKTLIERERARARGLSLVSHTAVPPTPSENGKVQLVKLSDDIDYGSFE